MATDAIKRRLAAILSADVVGYSRLMGADEESTFDILRQCRESIDGCVAEKGGCIVATGGDSVLAEFPSAVEAVRCALAMQEGIARCNIDRTDDRRMRFRIGINLGDVMINGDDILGDGVNIAARLEQIAEPDSIYIFGTVYDQVRNKLDLAYSDLGPQSVKNIDQPVRAYRVSEAQAETVPAASGGADSGPAKPTIAVLPFDNMSRDEEQEYFVDGMTEDIITELSRNHDLFVIARNSTFTYKGKAVDVTEVGRELGVRYIVEGSVRKAETVCASRVSSSTRRTAIISGPSAMTASSKTCSRCRTKSPRSSSPICRAGWKRRISSRASTSRPKTWPPMIIFCAPRIIITRKRRRTTPRPSRYRRKPSSSTPNTV
ncbi:MAG TPA: adenylate/guanylate cyclase domain-containing protein [Alphaproteobacteria bacterium]|nr:adenylate/guanylate cyclase domain-containing protein [Alphaproteobacteria bacterium]